MAGRCDCRKPCNCCASGTASIAKSGSGSANGCFQFSVRYSTDAGNRARAGDDGAVYADTCLLGPDGTPLNPNEDGCVQLPAPCILDYNGDPIEPVGGCIQLPTNGAPPDFGCGLKTDGETGELMVDTSATDFAALEDLVHDTFDGTYANASPIFCGPDGKLRGKPDHVAASAGQGTEVLLDELLEVPDTYTSAAATAAVLTNPSPCRRMIVRRFVTCTVGVSTPATGLAVVRLQESIDGGAWATVKEAEWPSISAGEGTVRYKGQLSSTRNATLQAGDSINVRLRVQIHEDGVDPNFPIAYYAEVSSSLLGVTV